MKVELEDFSYSVICPFCHHVLDGMMATRKNARPSPGALNVCTDCGTVSMFTESMDLLMLSRAQLKRLPREENEITTKLLGASIHTSISISKTKLLHYMSLYFSGFSPLGCRKFIASLLVA